MRAEGMQRRMPVPRGKGSRQGQLGGGAAAQLGREDGLRRGAGGHATAVHGVLVVAGGAGGGARPAVAGLPGAGTNLRQEATPGRDPMTAA